MIAYRPLYLRVRAWWYRAIYYPLYPIRKRIYRPVFIVGCGRSGTTLFGRILGQHPQLAYLHEPRHIWAYEPRTNIWSNRASRRDGKLRLDPSDVDEQVMKRIARAFAVEVQRQRAQRLVEKLPVNSFRIGYIRAMFPDAQFIQVIRDGRDVAHSIARQTAAKRWFRGQKWTLLADYASECGEQALVGLCTDDLLKGLLEWRLHVQAIQEAFYTISPDEKLTVRYEDLVRHPNRICNIIQEFVGVVPCPEVGRFAAQSIRYPQYEERSLSPAMQRIGGDALGRLGYLDSVEENDRSGP